MKLKINKKNISLVLASVLIVTISCSRQEDQAPQPLSYSYEKIDRMHPTCDRNGNDKQCVDLSYSFPTFSGSDTLAVTDSLREDMQRFIFESDERLLTEKSFDDLAKEWFALYDSTLAAMPDYNLPWEQQIGIRIIRQTPEYISVEFSESEFTGGAHGNEIKMYRMYSIPDGERLDLSDLVEKDKEEQLAVAAETVFRELKKFPDDVDYDERDYHFKDGIFALNRNFALTDRGLLFHYNPYEIAPYSEGPTRLVLTYEQIDTLLADSFRPSSDVNKD